MDEEILGSVLHGIKPKDYTPIQVRPTPEFGGIQLTEEQQAKKDNMGSVKDGEILPLNGFVDTVEAQWESAKDLVKSTDVYKNLFGNSAPDDNRLEQSEKLGSALGIAPQLIASDPDMYKAAVTTYERQRNAAALNNQPFSAKTLNELYPELDTEDPVATTIALKDYTNILKNREAAAQGAAVYTMPESKLTDLSNVIGYLYDTGTHFVGTAYEAGQALDAQSELMYKASIGEISDEEVEKAIPDLMNAQKAYNAEIGDSYVAKIVGETISQLSMQKNMIMRGAAEIIAPIAPLAQPILAATKTNLPQIATLGAASAAGAVGATGAVAGAAVTGAAALTGLIALGTASVFTGTYRAEAGQAYWDWRTKKDKNGKSVYTREQAIGHAKRVGAINAAIETGAWELALKGITKVWGSDAAKAVIKNEAAMKKLIGAGRAAVGAKAIGYGAKQFVKVAAPEIAEEGLQSLSADMDTRLFGKETVPVREMMGNALDAMIEAVPSVVGMSIGGAALAGAGAHRAMKRIAGLSEMKDSVIEFKRENERSMLQKLMDLRSESSLYKKAPETYRKTLQNQLDHTGSGTLYIDASAAAENEKTHDALNKLVEDGTITAKELDDAIKTGKPLEVETGKYMQTATPETHEALSDYTTMDKGEKTIYAIREERQRMKDMIDIVTMTREKREAAATEKILNDHFSDDTDIGREDRDTAREILSGGLDHIEDTCKTILQEAKDTWGKLTGVKELQDYMERRKTQDANTSNEKGVDMFDVGEGKDRVHLRVSKNPDWYQDFYGAYGRAPNQRELYDIAQEKIIAENDKGDEESKAAIAEIEEAKKRVESIERVSETLKSLNKEDLIAQTLLDPETYEEAYKPLLAQIQAAGNGAVTKAARDSALILAKLAENFHRNYGVPLKLAMIAAGEVSPETAHQLNQSAIENELQLVKEKYWNTDEWMKAPDGTPTKLTEHQWLIAHSEPFKKWFGDWDTVEKINGLINGVHVELAEKEMQHFQKMDFKAAKEEAKDVFRKLFSTVKNNTGYPEPAAVKRKDGEEIVVPMSALKEIRRHSADRRVLVAVSRLPDIIRDSTFLFESEKDLTRNKRLNQTTTGYRYYGIKVGNKPGQYIRIVVRTDENGKHYLYDMDFNGADKNKKSPHQTMLLDPKNESQSDKSFFTHSIQEWLVKVKETTDKIGENGEVLASVVNDFEESSTYHQMAEEYAHDVLSGKLTKKGTAERQLDADEKSFADSVDRFMAGKISTDTIQVMRTPLVMRLVGAEVLPVEISVSDLKKVLVDKHTDITPDIIKQIPRALTDPMMIFSTYSGKNGEVRKVIVLELKDKNGATIVIPMELERKKGNYEVNQITSAYGKTDKKTRRTSFVWFQKQLQEGKLEYANRKKATDWISSEQPHWLIPEEKVDNLLSAPNVANEEDLVKLKSENPTYYQTAADKDLVAMHNIDLGNLAAAIKLGGLPVPSIAVTKKQTSYTGFGDATLIMKKDTVDPSKTPVFSRDAWTGVFPKVVRLANMKRLTSFVEKAIEPLQKELPREAADYGDIYNSYILRNANNKNGDVQKMLEDSLNSAGYKYYFLKTINKEPKLKWRKKGLSKELIDHPEILQACQGLEKKYGEQGLKELLYEGPFAMLEESTGLKKANDLIVNELSKKPEGNESPFLKRVHERQQARLVNGETLHSLLSDYLERDKKVFEGESFEQQLDKRIKANQNTFNAWKESFRDEMLGESVIRDSGKPADLENIVDAMLGNLKNAQKGFAGFGIGNIIASSAKKIESFGEMHREADRNMDESTNIETSLDKSEQYTKVKNKIIDFTDRMAETYKWEDHWESCSDASQVLMSMMSGKTFKASARKFGFTYSAALEKQAKEIIKEVKDLPAKYFEAKPQRAVRFSEVAAAVMPQNASKEIKDYLRAQGVTIRLYDPRIEGDRERVTNSAQDRVKQYFQEGSNYQGSYDRNANVIELFDGANESTVIHEGAHMFLSMLENMSQMSEENVATYFNGDTAKARAALKSMQGDLFTIRSWSAFSEEHLAEYKGTILEKEFTQYANDIQAGKAGAMERWMQERFARGFEKYLMDGSAPTKEMQGVFRRFKKWLTDIYKTAKNLGNVELTPEIKDIFDRMISTEAEINAWAAQRKLEAIDKTVNVNQSELGNLKAWAESVKDKALEKAMSYYLHMVREEAIENFTASISSEEERTSFVGSLGEENEIYQIETIYNSDTFPTKKDRDEFLQMAGLTEKDLKEKLRAAGGTTEERWNKHIEEMVQHYREEALTPEAIRGMAEEILRSPEGMAKKSRIEAMLLEKKVSAYIHLVNSMQMELKRSKDKKKTAREIRKRLGLVSEKETTEVDKQTDVIAKSEDKIAKLEKQKKLLKEQLEKAKAEAAAAKGENQSRKESQTILEGNMRALEAELEKERAQRAKADSTTKDAELTAADLAVQLQTMVDGLKESRDAMRFDMREIKQDARNTLGGEKLSHATSWRWWENKAQIAEARAMKAAAGNDWEGAAYWKREQAQCLTMAKFARANEEEIRRTLHGGGGKVTTPLLNENGMERYGILGILNRISRTDKPVMMKDDARYFVQHMAYVLGLTKKDGILPIDESGQERPFNWRWLAVEMNPMQAMDDDRYMAEDIIPGWMRSAFDGTSSMKLKDLTMDQFREMAKVMKAVYKLGRREYEGNTLGTSFDEASQKIHDEILGNWTHRVATPGLKNQTATGLDRLGTKIHSLIKDIALPEILIERLGTSAYEYFYKPMDKAAAHLRELKSEARVTFRKNFAIYSRKEWTAIRSKKLYTIGLDERGKPVSYTKEQLLSMALNFGTKSNRERLIETLWLSDTLNTDEKTILDMLDKNLTDKDWDFVESVWEHLNSYWGERNKVQNDLYGTPLGKVQGEDFTLKSGRVIHGAYYRIKYDPLSSTKTSNFSTTDIAKMDMQNISSFSLGMGSTKQRAGASGGQKLRLDLDVYVEAVNEAMQHIAMREATVDVYKLLNRKEVVTAIENTAGPETLSLLQGWAKDCWHSSIKDMSEWDSTLGRARRRFNFTTMGFRFSTALLNIGNITGMMERMGAANAIKAVGDFYFHGNIVEQRRFIQAKSTMMRDRGATIDRDMYMQDRLPVGKNESEFRSKIEHGKYGVDTLNSKAYWLIQATDEMFSLPEWLFTYKRAMAAMEIEGKLNRDEMDAEAVRLADKAVRETFGSNETKDQTGFIRKNGILAQMTTFYSYTNLVTNQFIRAGYVLYDKGDVKPLLAATWYWWILGALVETALREIGDDSDDEDKWKKKFLHVIASGGPIGGVPIAREAVPWTVDFFTGKSFGSAAPDAPFFDTLKHMEKFLKATKKGDLIEMGRGATKVITRTSIPVPDTITDAFWNFMRMVCTDTEFTMWDWFRKSLWDKTLKEKKK
uniref:MuF-C-terminal domain-containing protein n=1 Tax=Dialister sp. TaxID=1955814 RepID=UPI004027B702